jgi:hypothetical protein
LKLHSGEAKQTIGGVPSTAFRPALFGQRFAFGGRCHTRPHG